MMTRDDIRNLLVALEFTEDMVGGTWRRVFPVGVELCVDCTGGKFLYKEAGIAVTTATTSNFSQPENFVVFECVCQLLAKGYKPKDIELEPAWKFGHNEKAARADIWVRTTDKSGKHSLLIIECKTAGREFESAWRDTCEDGGQLFSYFHQERATSFLCLYTSWLSDTAISRDYRLINVRDNEDYLKQFKKPRRYDKADNAKALFAVWRDTCRLDFAKVGLLEPDIAPYKPGKNKYSLNNDTHPIDHASMQRKYNEFATILRQHNVSGRENAFDKLVNLFLAKVVDESRNGGELMFYWKGVAYDSAFDLQDRLESLYSIGMKEFLGETVTYIREEDIKKAFRRFEKDPDATKDAVLDYFRRLKFYTNNDFSFIDVHNERLFLENAAILLKIVQMLEDIRLKTDEPNQFLGDLFEGFLDNGVKQSEGQFFTPLPVVRFIVSSLPLQEMVRNLPVPPRVIDYACGAGHFLNEYAQQIKPFIEAYHKGREKDFHSVITGVEKEYRLSKVAKVAAFMYGEDDIRIVYADALMKSSDMPEESFDILVANPPYSVKGFLETLSDDDRARYDLAERVSDISKNNSIETFFVERAAQLMKPCGVAAIILPASILSNGDGVYTRCREIILENFDVVAIAEFGSGTFEMTGTNTITLFLRKKDAPPDFADHWRNRADAWFAAKHEGDEVFDDAAALERYCAKRGFDLAEYKLFLGGARIPTSPLWNTSAFRAYRDAFAKKTAKKKWTEEERETEEYYFIRSQERDRLYYFLLADANPVPVLLVKMPTETKAAKAFLGYEWSRAKGNEGIKYLGGGGVIDAALPEAAGRAVSMKPPQPGGGRAVAPRPPLSDDDTLSRNRGIKSIKTPLFDNARLHEDNDDAPKLNSLIRKNFRGILSDIPEELKPFARRVPLTGMLDFDAATFDKQIKTSATENVEVESKFPLVRLGEVATIVRGVTYDKNDQVSDETDVRVLTSDNITLDGHFEIAKTVYLKSGVTLPAEKRLRKDDCFMCFASGSKTHVGKVCLIRKDTDCFAGGFMGILRVNGKMLPVLLFETLNSSPIREIVCASSRGTNIQNLSNSIANIRIPLPPLAVQKAVAKECAAVDADYAKAKKVIEDGRAKIVEIMAEVRGETKKLEELLRPVSGATVKIQENVIQPAGAIPVITQERDRLIAGYADGVEPITDVPLIVFGDHTCAFKYVDFPFVRGADGTQLLKTDESVVSMRFLCANLQTAEIEHSGKYERHFKYLKRMDVPVPSLAEQKKVVAAVEAVEAKIAAAKEAMSACPARKREILLRHGVVM